MRMRVQEEARNAKKIGGGGRCLRGDAKGGVRKKGWWLEQWIWWRRRKRKKAKRGWRVDEEGLLSLSLPAFWALPAQAKNYSRLAFSDWTRQTLTWNICLRKVRFFKCYLLYMRASLSEEFLLYSTRALGCPLPPHFPPLFLSHRGCLCENKKEMLWSFELPPPPPPLFLR